MNIDGNEVRIGAIDAVTAIEVIFTDVHEGTDRIARGSFEVLVRGARVTIRRTKRCMRGPSEMQIAESYVRGVLGQIRAPVVAVLNPPDDVRSRSAQ